MRERGMQGRTDEGKIGRRSEGASDSAEPVPHSIHNLINWVCQPKSDWNNHSISRE